MALLANFSITNSERKQKYDKKHKKNLKLYYPPPPPPPLYIRLLNRCVVVSPKTARSLTQTFLAKIPKLAVFSALLTHAAAPLNREQKGSGLFVFHNSRRFLKIAFAVLGLFLFTHCYKGGGGINPYLGDRLPPDISDGLAIPAPPPCQDSEFRGDGSFLDPYVVCSPQLFYEMANRNEQGTYFVLSQDIDLGGVVQAPLFDPAAPCGDPMSFRAFLGGRETRIINYRMDITQSGIYHPTERRIDLFGVCIDNVDGIIVDFRSPYEVIKGCGVFTETETGGFDLRRETETGPFLLCSLEQLEAIDDSGANLAESYILLGGLDLGDNVYSAPVIDGTYRGVFDGNRHSIKNLNIDSGGGSVGFFRALGGGGAIRNLGLENLSISGNNPIGGLVGTVDNGIIENCYVRDDDDSVDISSQNGGLIGGLVGISAELELRDTYVENVRVNVETGSCILGGLIGEARRSGGSGISRLEIERCYVANSLLSSENCVTSGGLVGRIYLSATDVIIQDSYTWENVIGHSRRTGTVGGLVGSLDDGGGGNSSDRVRITNSYTSYQSILNGEPSGTPVSGGLVGGINERGLIIRNSFSPTSFGGWIDVNGNVDNAGYVGGLLGRVAGGDVAEIYDSYFTGQITCIPRSRSDACGGLVGSLFGSDVDNEIERSYTTAQVISHSTPNTIGHQDGASLVTGVAGSSAALTLNLGTDSVYFIQDRLSHRGNSYPIEPGARSIQSTSQACADIDQNTGMSLMSCPAMIASGDASNRALTMDQMQTAPSSSTNDGNSPAKLGDAFLYRDGWCPRVCRSGVTPCTDETSLVGFDASGQPLPGPGGGLIAQANNEGDRCFDVEPLDITAPLVPPVGPPLMSLRACTVSGNFSADFIALASSVSSAHSSPSDPSANDTLSVRFNNRPQQTGVAATVTGTAAALNVTSAAISAGNFMGNAVTVVIQITALDVSMPGTLCMDENTTEIGVDLIVATTPMSTTRATVPNGTYIGGSASGDTRDGCTLSITQAGTMSGEVVEAQLDNCILVTPASSDTPASLISVKFQLEIP